MLLNFFKGNMMPRKPLLCDLCYRFFIDLFLLLSLLFILFHNLLSTFLLLALPDLFILVDPLQHLNVVISANLTTRQLSFVIVV